MRTRKMLKLETIPPLLALAAFCASPARCQTAPGVTGNEILIGSCSALEGPSKFLGTETVTGAKAYFDTVNEAGGVEGRKLRLVVSDDSYDPVKTQACFDKMMSEEVFALGFFVGTPTAVKYLPPAESNKIPLVGSPERKRCTSRCAIGSSMCARRILMKPANRLTASGTLWVTGRLR
jgi:branched-chain amino acid transport system substrate-binding protein